MRVFNEKNGLSRLTDRRVLEDQNVCAKSIVCFMIAFTSVG